MSKTNFAFWLLINTFLFPILFPQPVFALTQRTTIAVSELNAKGVGEDLSFALTDILRGCVFQTGLFDIMTKEDMTRLLSAAGEKRLLKADCDTAACITEIAGVLKVEMMISGSVGKVGQAYVINLRLIDTGKALIINTFSRTYFCKEDDLIEKIKQAGLILLNMEVDETLLSEASRKMISKERKDGWQVIKALSQAREGHTATLFDNGTVLVVGGKTGNVALAGCELFNPVFGDWGPVGNLNQPRMFHTATLLNDGRVLVAGGYNSKYETLASCEIYDPYSKSWTMTSNLSQGTDWQTANLLSDGRVLITGGHNSNLGKIASTEAFFPATARWVPAGSLSQPRIYHASTLLNDGRVLIIGGESNRGSLAACEIMDLATGGWPVTNSLDQDKAEAADSVSDRGRFDVSCGWKPTGNMKQSRHLHTATLLADGRVLVTGGYNSTGSSDIFTCEIYDPAKGAWSAAANLGLPRYRHTATLLHEGRVLIAGGESNEDTFIGTCEIYDAFNDAWEVTADLNQPRYQHTATLLKDGRVLVVGGNCNYQAISSCEIYTPEMISVNTHNK